MSAEKMSASSSESSAVSAPVKPNLSESVSSAEPSSENQAQEESFGRMVREIFESVAIAFVVAFLFRTFLAEMFIIPTGSMAPTLMGQHKDVTCPQCSAPYQVGVVQGQNVNYSICPNCNAVMDYANEAKHGNVAPNYPGDRILVGKYPYYFSRPQRWDVAVFLFPGGGNTNYIKRCVGLPGETIRIQDGDIYVKPSEPLRTSDGSGTPEGQEAAGSAISTGFARKVEAPFHIARKPPEKILATMIPVYQNDYQNTLLRQVRMPSRWYQLEMDPAEGTHMGVQARWQESADGREFYFRQTDPDEMTGWLAYRHLVPLQPHWRQAAMDQCPDVRPRLITDMTAYNTGMSGSYSSDDGTGVFSIPIPDSFYGRHWVKDLVFEATIDVRSLKTGFFQVGLARGRMFWCKVDLETGEVTLEIPAVPDFGEDVQRQKEFAETNANRETVYFARAKSNMNRTDIYHFRFANVDDQLHVWVDGKVLEFDQPTAYIESERILPSEVDLEHPVQVGCRNCEVNLSHISLYRDIYYVAREREDSEQMSDFVEDGHYGVQVYTPPLELASDPALWEAFQKMRFVEFRLDTEGEPQYFMLGDNSTNSADSRCWTYPSYDPRRNQYLKEYYVPESLLVGEAYYVYWPHSWKPFWPNWKKFRKIK